MGKFDQQLLRLKSALGITSDQDIAALLGLSKAAFSDRKKRDAFPEDKLLALVATRPDLVIDPRYVLTGQTAVDRYTAAHGHPPASYAEVTQWAVQEDARGYSNVASTQHLPPDEQLLLEAYRGLAAPARKALLAELLKGGKKTKATPKAQSGDAGVKVSGRGHRVAGRDYHEKE